MKEKLLGTLSLALILLGCLAIAGFLHINYFGHIKQQIIGMGLMPTGPEQKYNKQDFTVYGADRYNDLLQKPEETGIPQVGDMTLKIPKIRLSTTVYSGISDDMLKKGVGLYPESNSPMEKNHNISIAGHRDIYGAEFYNLDKLEEGDSIFLEIGGSCYVYDYEFTSIVESSDTTLLKGTDESIITLVSCHPVGTSEKRIVVRGRLREVWLEQAEQKG